jgi:hypothetical protein
VANSRISGQELERDRKRLISTEVWRAFIQSLSSVKTAAGAAAFITGQDYHKQARVTGRHTGFYPVAASRLMTSAWALRTLLA